MRINFTEENSALGLPLKDIIIVKILTLIIFIFYLAFSVPR